MSNIKAYIRTAFGKPIDDWAFTAYQGFSKLGTDIHFFEDIEEVPVNRNNIVVTFIDETRTYFNSLEIDVPKPLSVMEELYPYCRREMEIITYEQLMEERPAPIFIKPYDNLKYFTAGVIDRASFYDYLDEMPKDTQILKSEVLDIVSEYRGFVINKQLVSLNHYLGDFRCYPDCKIIDSAVEDYISSPCGYSIDFGVTADGQTVLIETNDGWSLGSYGCDPSIYVRLLINRWLEIMKQNNI